MTMLDILEWAWFALVGVAVLVVAKLAKPIVFPTVITYPWPKDSCSYRQQKREKDMTVVLAGSFNPPHHGHLVMMDYLTERYVFQAIPPSYARRYGKLIVVVGKNPKKKYKVTPEQRRDLIRRLLNENPKVDVRGKRTKL